MHDVLAQAVQLTEIWLSVKKPHQFVDLLMLSSVLDLTVQLLELRQVHFID